MRGILAVVAFWMAVGAGVVQANDAVCSGRVLTKDGKPVAGATLKLIKITYDPNLMMPVSQGIQTMTLKADGAFTFKIAEDKKSPGYSFYIVMAKGPGLSFGWLNWDFRQEKNLREDITLTAPSAFGGVVVDEGGKPLAGVKVVPFLVISGSQPDRPKWLFGSKDVSELVATTGADGRFVFSDMPSNATAEFTAEAPGRAKTMTVKGNVSTTLQFAAGKKDIKIVMPIESRIVGRVVEKGTQKGIGGVLLRVMSNTPTAVFRGIRTVSREDGTFDVGELAAGTYLVQSASSLDKLADWVSEAVTVVLETGKTKSDVVIPVAKGGIAEISVRDSATGKPVAGVMVGIRSVSDNQWINAGGSSDKEGIVRMRLSPGQYQLVTIQPSEGYRMQQLELPFTIEEGKTFKYEAKIEGKIPMQGVVKDAAGKPVKGAACFILPMVGPREMRQTDDKGAILIDWDPGWWGQQSTEFYLVVRHVERNLAAAVPVQTDTKRVEVKLEPGVTITGLVVDSEGKPIPKATAMVMMQANRWGAYIQENGQIFADDKGRYQITAIPSGYKYTVTASADGFGQRGARIDLTTRPAGQVEVETLTLDRANMSVTGVVVDSEDNPVANAQIHTYGDNQPLRQSTTDQQGQFKIEGVCPGSIQLNVYMRGPISMSGHARAQGGDTDVRIVMSENQQRGILGPTTRSARLTGKPLPAIGDFEIPVKAEDIEGKMVLLCFWDMSQRPSRYCVSELAKMAGELATKGVVIVSVQAEMTDAQTLKSWTTQAHLPFPVGTVKGKSENVLRKWGVGRLPWLVLTDRQHKVTAEGFRLEEIGEKVKSAASGK